MGFLPIFILGLIVGGLFEYVIIQYKREVPSETKLKILENEITTLKDDKEMLHECIHRKDDVINELKAELTGCESVIKLNKLK